MIIAAASALVLCLAIAATRAFSDRTVDRGGSSAAERAVCARIRAHPQCPRAHLAYAQLLAEAGRNIEARRELAEAERLQPGLSFAPRATVDELARKLGMSDNLPTQTQFHF